MSGPSAPVEPPVEPPGGIDWIKVIAGALAAISSAVLLSTLGAAGTVIGAALGSVIVSVSSSLYSQGLARSKQQLAEAQEAALRRVGLAQAEVRRARRRADVEELPAAEAHLQYADRQLADARVELAAAEPAATTVGWRDRWAALPWKRIALLTAAFFVVAVVVITVFELIAGRPVSSLTGGSSNEHGTSISHLGGGSSAKPTQTPSPSTVPSEAPTPTVTPSSTPTVAPSPSASVTATPSPTPTPSVVPSSSPTPAPTESPSVSPSAGLVP